jgi:vancomycin resistance protein YoaR
MKSSKKIKPEATKKINFKKIGRITFWFFTGALITLFLILSFSYLAFQNYYKNRVYPGTTIDGVDFSNKTESEVKNYFLNKNKQISDVSFTFNFEENVATVSAKEIEFGYDENLIATQALSLGRSENHLSNINLMLQAYLNGLSLPATYRFSDQKLEEKLTPIYEKINKDPVEAVFNFENGKVAQFRASENGRKVNPDLLTKIILSNGGAVLNNPNQKLIMITIPITVVKPNLTTEKVNKMGIKELIGSGTSLFQHSIENRIYNVNLASSRVNGTLVAPGETFSFVKTVGEVTSSTGYKQAYVITNGKTVLGDGGGLCQVSTTLFRAALNAGLPIVERHPHAYRVGYYEQDSPPGIDATVFEPSVDFKFKNDTGHHLLIQSLIDPNELRLTFMIYGTSDGRVSEISVPQVWGTSPAPPDRYEDDPNLPVGVVKQVDFAAAGANTSFTRTVTRNGEELISDKFISNYRPWQAVFLRGTKTQ